MSKRGHWQQVCRASAANTVYQADTGFQSSTAYVITHDIAEVQSAPKGIFVDLSTTPSPATTHRIRFQVLGCSCKTIHVTDLQKMSPVKVEPSSVRLLDYPKIHHPNWRSNHIALYSPRPGYQTWWYVNAHHQQLSQPKFAFV